VAPDRSHSLKNDEKGRWAFYFLEVGGVQKSVKRVFYGAGNHGYPPTDSVPAEKLLPSRELGLFC
jgi:hypothetical protein